MMFSCTVEWKAAMAILNVPIHMLSMIHANITPMRYSTSLSFDAMYNRGHLVSP